MKYNFNIREEIFGATLNNIENGSREYINKKELKDIMQKGLFYKNSLLDNLAEKPCIKFTPLKSNNIIHFSFADIVFIELTRACNLRCKHCLNDSGVAMNNQLTYEEIKNLILSLASCGLQEVRLTGGEPLLFDKIYDVIKLSTDNGLYVSLGTNGTLITEEVAIKLKKSGLKKAVVSIDGNEEVHDNIRGKGNYKKAFIGLKNLKNQGIVIRVNSVIMKENMNDVIAFAKKLHTLKIPLFIRRFIESGRGEKMINNMLTSQDYAYVKECLNGEIQEGTYINGHYLRNDEGVTSRIKLPFEIKGCKAGQRAIAIMPDGQIHLCGFLAAQNFSSVGNIRNVKDWHQFWNELQSHDRLIYLREKLNNYNKIPNIQETYCLAYIQRYLNKKVKK